MVLDPDVAECLDCPLPDLLPVLFPDDLNCLGEGLSFLALLLDAMGLVGSVSDGVTQGSISSKLIRPLSWSSFSSTAVGLYLHKQSITFERILLVSI